ncbi:hypothetical protein F4553_000963 [Allocatelliglobosispora scoriae]|uniref:Uncharacterized protein n=1 Tax=Allocatelliglobosispora scoriae TaxID=643052 RepID=A0A841BH23_9ACTN|nr:hypothetical protein [Allocatelliglobosispora scoriae]MBB5867584.1 hypothetical protein [Allocatelliglobosispora scoriae]
MDALTSRITALWAHPRVGRDPELALGDAARDWLAATGQPAFAAALAFEREAGGLILGRLRLGLRTSAEIPAAWEVARAGDPPHPGLVHIGYADYLVLWIGEDGRIWAEPDFEDATPAADSWVAYVEGALAEAPPAQAA